MSAKSKMIYVVTEGEYSDYHIVGVFSTRKLAKRCQSAVLADNIEEYPLDEGDYALYDAGYHRYCVTFNGSTVFGLDFRGGMLTNVFPEGLAKAPSKIREIPKCLHIIGYTMVSDVFICRFDATKTPPPFI